MGNQIICTYYINGQQYDVVGCFDKDTPQDEFDFYDIYNTKGQCLNEGEPLYEFPTYKEIIDFLDPVSSFLDQYRNG